MNAGADLPSLGERRHNPAGCHRNGLPHLGACLSGDRPTFTCPDCLASSRHRDDVANAYCFHCHAFKAEPHDPPRCLEPTCRNFGDHDFGEGTCPAEHGTPPAWRVGGSTGPAAPGV